ncbi:MAG TPA: HIT family protein [Candidatus Nanoarchaeia archaeon]|nr:HIT family protein [Candidatus Nanoarchaeia archaeon]
MNLTSQCEYCEILRKEKNILASSSDAVVAVRDKVVTPGQITIFPKEHYPIMEMVPEEVLQQCAILANKVSIAVFESLSSQGTNILVRNGLGAGQDVAHFGIEIIPRKEGDGLNFDWKPRQLMEDEIEMVHTTLLEAVEESRSSPKKEEKRDDKKEIKIVEGKENYLLKSIKRIP